MEDWLLKETACSSSFADERLNGELSRVCNVLIVHHHPSNSMRTSPKAHQRIFLPEEPAASQPILRFSNQKHLHILHSCLPCCCSVGSQLKERTREIVITSPIAVFHEKLSSERQHWSAESKTNHNTWTVCSGVSLSASVWYWQPSNHLRPLWSCNPTTGAV